MDQHRAAEFDRLLSHIEQESGIRADAIIGRCRVPSACRARRRLMIELRRSPSTWRLQEIGDVCGGRHHTTVIWYLQSVSAQKRKGLLLPFGRRALA